MANRVSSDFELKLRLGSTVQLIMILHWLKFDAQIGLTFNDVISFVQNVTKNETTKLNSIITSRAVGSVMMYQIIKTIKTYLFGALYHKEVVTNVGTK